MLNFITAGESHGPELTVILDGFPAGLPLSEEMITADLVRRQEGPGSGGRMLIETDAAIITAGVMEGRTTGAPIAIKIVNRDHANWKGKAVRAYTIPRPGHADLSAVIKYGFDDIRPALERASARETAARTAMGAVCRAFLRQFGITVSARIKSIAGRIGDFETVIHSATKNGETLGGVIEITAEGLPPGLGTYAQWNRRLDGRLAAALLSIPAMKGLEIGDAFQNAALPGTRVHDAILPGGARETNNCGGLEGGITNGQPLLIRLAMKPIPTTIKSQKSYDLSTGKACETKYERSDVCPVPRAVVVTEAMTAFVLAQALLEKLGGDSIAEMKPRFSALPRNVRIAADDRIFWP